MADTERQTSEEPLQSATQRPWVRLVTLGVLAVFLLSILVGAFLL
jgi:hypothetical protein